MQTTKKINEKYKTTDAQAVKAGTGYRRVLLYVEEKFIVSFYRTKKYIYCPFVHRYN